MNSERPPEWMERTVDDDEDAPPPTGELEKHPYLLILQGSDRGRRVRLEAARLTIGRAPEADIQIDDERTSRIHCTLLVEPERVDVEDNGSRNGTFVDDEAIERAPLDPESLLRIGRTLMRIEWKLGADAEMEEEVFRAATTDALTRIPNRRRFEEDARAAVSYARRHERPLSLLMLDVDHFKRINDTHGHMAGDHALIHLAGLLSEGRREEDLLCRYGGEEFLLLLRDANAEGARVTAERIRARVESESFRYGQTLLQLTISVGLAAYRSGESLEQLIERADAALYQAKEAGRNRVAVAD